MTCHKINGWTVCTGTAYEFEFEGVKYLFEDHLYSGPARLRLRDLEPWDKSPGDKFWRAYEAWSALPRKEREQCLVK